MDQSQAVSLHGKLETEEYPALKVKEILEHILEFCPLGDLKQCRLVSTFWRESSVKAFNSFPVKLTSAAKTREFVRILRDPRPAAGSRVELYKNFVLSHSSLTLCNQSAALWTLTGSNIKSLELSGIMLKTVDEFRNIVLNVCSNLKELTLRNVSLAAVGQVRIVEPTEWEAPQFGENKKVRSLTLNQRPGSLGISWMELVNYFPSLKALRLEEALQSHEFLLMAVKKIREHDATRLELDDLRFWIADPQSMRLDPNSLFLYVTHLENTGIQWRKLSVDLSAGVNARTNTVALVRCGYLFAKIISQQGNTLETLTISRNRGENLDPINFLSFTTHNFKHLQELDLQSEVFTSMWFVKLMPNLRKLSFCQPNFSADPRHPAETDLRGVQLNRLVELKANCKISMDGLELLCNLVPNVEHLKMTGLDNDMFRLVCERWPNLVELDIVEGAVDECGITGMELDDVKRVNEQRGKSKWKRVVTACRANITSLKHLRKIFLKAEYRPGDSFNRFLGYCAKMHGFEKTRNLEEVVIYNYTLEEKAYKDVFVGGRRINFIILPSCPRLQFQFLRAIN